MAGKKRTPSHGRHRATGWRLVLEILKTLAVWLVLLSALFMMVFTVISVCLFDRNDRSLFGYQAFIVRSDSMAATDFAAGDLIITKQVDPDTLQVGDIIAFFSPDPDSYGEVFTHKIRHKVTNSAGEAAFITYGTTTGMDDAYSVPHSRVIGQYQKALPGVGKFFAFMKTVPGYICCIFVPFLLLIVFQGLQSIRLFRQYRAAQMKELETQKQKELAQLEAQRAEIAAQREENLQLLRRLEELQAQLVRRE